MPEDGVLQISFDRYLLPSTTIRQSFAILDGNNQPLQVDQAPIVTYDPVARVITLSNPQPGKPWLTQGVPYKLIAGIPPEGSDIGGVRAIDRATLDPNQPREFAFFVGPPANKPIEPRVDFCTDVLPTFAAKCDGPTCHGSSTSAAASLILTTSQGVSKTAIGQLRVAQGANTTGRAGAGEPPGALFGVNMPLVDPGNPGNSWLLYKMEMARPPTLLLPKPKVVCAPPSGAPPAPAPSYVPSTPGRFVADDLERDILNDFVLGREMPYPAAAVTVYGQQPLTFDERERMRLWIAQGAIVRECGGCGIAAERLDAGAPGP